MWRDALKEVQEKRDIFYTSGTNPGVPLDIINDWAVRVQEALGVKPPKEFMDVLREINGVEWNGYILYGVDRDAFPIPPECSLYGLIEQNEIWYEVESQKSYLFLGESDISWYVYEIATHHYLELDNPSGREVDVFQSFSEMFEKMLNASLQ